MEFLSLGLDSQHFWTEFNRHQSEKYFSFISGTRFLKALAEQTMQKNRPFVINLFNKYIHHINGIFVQMYNILQLN